MSPFETTSVFEVEISKMNMEQTVRYLENMVDSKQVTQVVTANPIMMMAADQDEAYKQMMQAAELVVPDGAGLVWAAKRLGNPVQERVAGIDLMHRLLSLGQQRQWRVYFIGASAEVIGTAVKNLQKQYPQLYVCGYRDGYFGESADQQVVQDVKAAEPQLLFVGRSASQQDPWIHKYKHELGVPVMMGVGGSFDVISGKLKRAPRIMQALKLEWFYRLLQEPWRYKRMLDLPKFVMKIIKK